MCIFERKKNKKTTTTKCNCNEWLKKRPLLETGNGTFSFFLYYRVKRLRGRRRSSLQTWQRACECHASVIYNPNHFMFGCY